MLFLYKNQLSLAKSRDAYFNSYILADELRQSSDDLTRMARAYVATGNSEFEREYWAILDIRNGKIPRPVDYNRIYWDFVIATGEKPRPDGETISLRDLMIKEGFDQNLGARPLKRVIQRQILDPLAVKIVTGEVIDGGRVLVDEKSDKIVFETPKLLPKLKDKPKLARAKK